MLKVLCINNRCVEHYLELNKIYVVVCTMVEKGVMYYKLEDIENDYFSTARFRIIEE